MLALNSPVFQVTQCLAVWLVDSLLTDVQTLCCNNSETAAAQGIEAICVYARAADVGALSPDSWLCTLGFGMLAASTIAQLVRL